MCLRYVTGDVSGTGEGRAQCARDYVWVSPCPVRLLSSQPLNLARSSVLARYLSP
jgi:hypothetical protein